MVANIESQFVHLPHWHAPTPTCQWFVQFIVQSVSLLEKSDLSSFCPFGVSNQLSLLGLQVFRVAPSLFMVEMSKDNGDTIEYHNVSISLICPCFLHELLSDVRARSFLKLIRILLLSPPLSWTEKLCSGWCYWLA